MHIEFRQRLAPRYDLRHARQRGHQRAQRPLHLKHHPRGARRNLRRIAGELDRIAKTLLGVQQNGLSGDVIRAGPQRLHEIPLGAAMLLGLPPPFVLIEAAHKVAEQQAAQRLVIMSVGKIRPYGAHAFVTGQRLIEAPHILQSNAAIGERLEIIRPQRERTVVACERIIKSLERVQRIAAVVMRLGAVRHQRQRTIVVRQRVVEPLQGTQRTAAIDARVGKIRPQRERAVATRQRLLEPLQRVKRIAAVGMRLGEIGSQRKRAITARKRRLEALQLQQHGGAVGQRLDIIGPHGDRAVEARQGLFEPL